MSLSANKIISILSERAGRAFDVPFQEELLDIVDYWASTILKQTLEKRPQDRKRFLQSFVIELERVPKIECPIEYGCILRTISKVPKPVRGSSTLFDYIGDPDMEDAWSVPLQDAFFKALSSSKYTGNRPKPSYRDGYIYIRSLENKELKYIGIQGVFSDFRAVRELKCDDSSCFDYDSPYPITNDMIQQVIQAILTTELRILPRKIDNDTEVEVVEKDD